MKYQPAPEQADVLALLERMTAIMTSNVERNNATLLDIDRATASLKLLKEQVDQLTADSNTLFANNEALRDKISKARTEMREYTEKTTARLERERQEFETVRIKERNKLIDTVRELDTRKAELDELAATLSEQEAALKIKEIQVNETLATFNNRTIELDDRAKAIEQADQALSEREKVCHAIELQQDRREASLKLVDEQTTVRQAEVEKIVGLASERLSRVEQVEKSQAATKEEMTRKALALDAWSKKLTKQEAQLNDRTATMATHGVK